MKKKNCNKNFKWKLVGEQLPWLLLYLLLIGLIWLLVLLGDAKASIAFDALRFTWFGIAGWLGWRFYCAYQAQKQLQEQMTQHQLPAQLPPGVLTKSYYQALKMVTADYQKKEKQQRMQTAKRQDYLRLWSHELKLPLTALKIAAENDNQVASELILPQLIQIENQLNLLLNYERLADFHQDLTFTVFRLEDVITEIIKENAILFINQQLKPRIQLPPDLEILSDRKWLHFCLQQVIFNSLKYATKKTPLIIKFTERTLIICDYGCGISSDDLPRVFEAGFTGKNGRQQQAATGMGLYLVKQITQELGIDFQLKSVEKQGTTANFIFSPDSLK